MGIIKLSNVDDYWDKNPLSSNSISEIITENYYKNINSFIHPEAEDSKDKEKIVNSIKLIMENSRKYFYPGTYIIMDERMIFYRGRPENIVYEISTAKYFSICSKVIFENLSHFLFLFFFSLITSEIGSFKSSFFSLYFFSSFLYIHFCLLLFDLYNYL